MVGPEARKRMRAAGGPEEVLEIFLREAVRLTAAEVDVMRETPVWRARVAAAHTIPRELEVVEAVEFGDGLGEIGIPVRLLAGTESPEFLRLAAGAVAERIPGADVVPLHGLAHQAMDFDPEQFVGAVFGFSAG